MEVVNANRTESENKIAMIYADEYKLLKTAGSDNHSASAQIHFAGMASETPIVSEEDFIKRIKSNKLSMFYI